MEELFGRIALAVLILWGLILVSMVIRRRTPFLRDIFLPASLLAGFLALLAGPQVLGLAVRTWIGEEAALSEGLFPEWIREVWDPLPGLLISVVFAALFLGKPIRGIGKMWRDAGPQVMLGHSLAWGQYVVGLALVLLLLGPIWGLPPEAGALLEISFVGGHGTVAGMSGAFEEMGFPEGEALGMGLATLGILSGAIIGTVLVNWAVRTQRIDISAPSPEEKENLSNFDEREPQEEEPSRRLVPRDSLSVHLALLGLAILIGYGLQQGLIWLELNTWGRRNVELFRYIPLFPLAMIGAIVVQVVVDRLGHTQALNRQIINRISAGSLDLIIAAALATLSLAVLGEYLVPLLILGVAAIAWNVAGFLILGPLLIPRDWFQRGSGDFGQSIGMAALGLLLIRLADPHDRSRASERFGYKQILFEPVLGGGLFTAASAPLIHQLGGWPILIATFILTTGFIATGIHLFKDRDEKD